MIALVPAFAAWAVIPLSPTVVVSKADAGLLYLLSLTSMGVYGVIIAGWAANSKYAFLGAMRSAAQMVAYEIAMGFALVGVLMATGSMNLGKIVQTQAGGIVSWNWFWLFPLLMVYFISGIAETNRAPFDVAEGRVGDRRRLSRRVLRHGVRAVLPRRVRQHDPDLGAHRGVLLRRLAGALRGYPFGLGGTLLGQPSFLWLFLKVFVLVFLFLWFRATFPRYRYDQIMRLGWKALIPVTLVWIGVEMVLAVYHIGPWARPWYQ